MSRRYKHLADGETLVLNGDRYVFPQKIMCCGCGLVHKTVSRVISPTEMEFTAWVDARATAARRRRRT